MRFNLAGLRCDDGDFLILATTKSANNALEIYGYRWEIETWQNEIKRIKIKNHGRKAMSFFRSGVNVLRRILCGQVPTKAEIRHAVQILFAPPLGIQMARLA